MKESGLTASREAQLPEVRAARSRSPSRMARIPFGHLSSRCIDVRELLRELGFGPTELFDPQATVPTEAIYALYRKAELMTADPALGAHLAEWVDFSLFEGVDEATEYFPVQLVLASATLGEGLARLARVFPIGFGDSRLLLERRGEDELRMRHEVSGEPAPQALCEFMVSWWTTLIRHATGNAVSPLAIRLARPAPPSTAEHARVLGQTPLFGAGENSVSVAIEALEAPIRTANPRLLEALELRARREVAGDEGAALISRVRGILDKLYSRPQRLGIEVLAEELGLSVRTLTRRLAEAGTSYRKQLDDVRGEAARAHLAAGRSVAEVASLLGFSEPGAFHRAFVRWFRRPPSSLHL